MEQLTAQPPQPRKWYKIWFDLWKHPGVETFRSILQEPGVKVSRAFIWLSTSGFITYFVTTLVYQILYPELIFVADIRYTTYWLCFTIVSPIIAIAGISISGLIYHGIAKLMGGLGTWDQLVYCFSAVGASFTLISGFFSIMILVLSSALQDLSVVSGWVLLPLSIYVIVLNVNAIDAVERIGTRKAVVTLFVPFIILALFVTCFASILMSRSGQF